MDRTSLLSEHGNFTHARAHHWQSINMAIREFVSGLKGKSYRYERDRQPRINYDGGDPNRSVVKRIYLGGETGNKLLLELEDEKAYMIERVGDIDDIWGLYIDIVPLYDK